MKKLAVVLVLVLVPAVQAAPFKKVLGESFPEIKAKDLVSDKEIDLAAELKKDAYMGAVVTFTCYTCPVVMAYEERMNKIVEEYGHKVLFLNLNANATETADAMKERIKDQKLKGRFAMDAGSKAAAAIGAGVTPEVYVLDKAGKIVFHGPVDDSQDPQHIETHLLSDALKALVSGGTIQEKNREVQAFGCGIKFPK